MTAQWVALEGVEGSGKSTQARLLADLAGAVLTREPGGTRLGEQLRGLLLDRASTIDVRAEALLMAADRAAHYEEVVRPALAGGRHVVTDRSAWSFLAYQGYGRGLALADLEFLSGWATGGRWPDLVLLVDVPEDESKRRRGAREADRFEAEEGGFHDRVRAGFAELAAAHPATWVTVDGTGPPEAVAARISAIWDARGR